MASYSNGLSTINVPKKQRDYLQLVMASSKSVNDLFKQQTCKQPKLMELDKGSTGCLQQFVPKENPCLGL